MLAYSSCFSWFVPCYPVNRRGGLIFPSIRWPVMETATSAQQRRVRHEFSAGSGSLNLALPTSCQSIPADSTYSKSAIPGRHSATQTEGTFDVPQLFDDGRTGSSCRLVCSGISSVSDSIAGTRRCSIYRANTKHRDDSVRWSASWPSGRSRHADLHSSVRSGRSRFSRVWSSRCSDDGDPSASHPADGRQHYGDFSTADVCNDDDARPCRASTLPGHKHRQSTGSDDPAEHSGLHAELLLLLLSKAVPGTSRTGGPRGELSSGPRCSHSACRDQRVQRSLHRSVRTDVYRSRRNGPRPLSVLQLSSPLVLGWPARLQRDNSRPGLVTEPSLLSHPEMVAVSVVENVTNKEHRSLGRQLLTESLLLAGISGLLGIVPVVWVSTSWRR